MPRGRRARDQNELDRKAEADIALREIKEIEDAMLNHEQQGRAFEKDNLTLARRILHRARHTLAQVVGLNLPDDSPDDSPDDPHK